MKHLLAILRSTHCRNTHHRFAVDAIPLVQTDAGRRLTRILLGHYDRYLTGATDPDTRFRDFQNHVIHVTDGYWGGAPRVAHQWYDRMQRYLRRERWGDAAHAAGVVSHYFTDPLQPLHTQQCPREWVLHAPIERSIYHCYNELLRLWKDDKLRVVFQLSESPGWLGEAILHSARFSNRKYTELLDGYDFDRGSVRPSAGFDDALKSSIAELVGLAVTGLARVLERAASDAEATRRKQLPRLGLAAPLATAMATVIPQLWRRRRETKATNELVNQIVAEFRGTGAVLRSVPAEVDIVHRVNDVYSSEKIWKQLRAERLASQATVVAVETHSTQPAEQQIESTDEAPDIIPFRSADVASRWRGDLSHSDHIASAPSVGPKTAARFEAIGIESVGEFLSADPQETADRLATYWITNETVATWQRQAVLMCQMPGVGEVDAQLLIGAGFDSANSIAHVEVPKLHARLAAYAATSAGRRYLRGASPPNPRRVRIWVTAATDLDGDLPQVA